MKLNKLTLLAFVVIVILPLSILLASCGANPVAPAAKVFISNITPATVSAFTPASGTTPAVIGSGIGSVTITVQGPGITIDTDNGVVFGLTVFTTGGTGVTTISYNYLNSTGIAPGTVTTDTHIYAYTEITTGAKGTFRATIPVSYK